MCNVNCPACKKNISNAFVITKTDCDKLNTTRRIVGAYCSHCATSFELEQYEHNQEWITTRYRRYVLKAEAWQEVAEIPVPLVVLGNDVDEMLELALVG